MLHLSFSTHIFTELYVTVCTIRHFLWVSWHDKPLQDVGCSPSWYNKPQLFLPIRVHLISQLSVLLVMSFKTTDSHTMPSEANIQRKLDLQYSYF